MTSPAYETLQGRLCRLRPYRGLDAAALCTVADDPRVARWMTAGFPSPYTRADAEWWIANVAVEERARHFAIEVDGALAGGIGVQPLHGEHDGSAVFGYWLGASFWNRGIATDAVRAAVPFAFGWMRLRRLEATVFAPNAASARVLEKTGFRLEGRLRESYVERDGTVHDGLLYARLASDPEP